MSIIPGAVCALCGRNGPDWSHLSNPASETVTEALSRKCDICGAPVGVLCHNPCNPSEPLPGRLVHIGRTEPR